MSRARIGDQQAARLIRCDELTGPSFDDFDRVGAGGDRLAASLPQVVDHLASRQHPDRFCVELGDEHRRARRQPRPALLAQQVGGCLAAAQPQRPGPVAVGRPTHHIATRTELLERQQSDRLLTERARVARLG